MGSADSKIGSPFSRAKIVIEVRCRCGTACDIREKWPRWPEVILGSLVEKPQECRKGRITADCSDFDNGVLYDSRAGKAAGAYGAHCAGTTREVVINRAGRANQRRSRRERTSHVRPRAGRRAGGLEPAVRTVAGRCRSSANATRLR